MSRDKLAAFATLYDVLVTFSQVLAPVLPFITEEIYQGLVQDESVSVHHTDYPKADTTVIDHDLESAMAVVRQIVTLGQIAAITAIHRCPPAAGDTHGIDSRCGCGSCR